MGAWIETKDLPASRIGGASSLPIWERGLKHLVLLGHLPDAVVAPYMGAWIETSCTHRPKSAGEVAPYMGAWIETLLPASRCIPPARRSLYGSVD